VVIPDARFRQNYAAAFARFLFHRDEAALAAAYELGRYGLEHGIGLLDIVCTHHSVVIDALPGIEGPQELAEAGAAFLVEVLASFDMAHRAFREKSD
jgi:Phosphoserine phosphatase RsbU, N-terminal domain